MVKLDPFQTVVAIRNFGAGPEEQIDAGWMGWRDTGLPLVGPSSVADADLVWSAQAVIEDVPPGQVPVSERATFFLDEFSQDVAVFVNNDFRKRVLTDGIPSSSVFLPSTNGDAVLYGLNSTGAYRLDLVTGQVESSIFSPGPGLIFGGSCSSNKVYGWGNNINGAARVMGDFNNPVSVPDDEMTLLTYELENGTATPIPEAEWDRAAPQAGFAFNQSAFEINLENGWIMSDQTFSSATDRLRLFRIPDLVGFGTARKVLPAMSITTDDRCVVVADEGVFVFHLSSIASLSNYQFYPELSGYDGAHAYKLGNSDFLPSKAGGRVRPTAVKVAVYLWNTQTGAAAVALLGDEPGGIIASYEFGAPELPQGASLRLPDGAFGDLSPTLGFNDDYVGDFWYTGVSERGGETYLAALDAYMTTGTKYSAPTYQIDVDYSEDVYEFLSAFPDAEPETGRTASYIISRRYLVKPDILSRPPELYDPFSLQSSDNAIDVWAPTRSPDGPAFVRYLWPRTQNLSIDVTDPAEGVELVYVFGDWEYATERHPSEANAPGVGDWTDQRVVAEPVSGPGVGFLIENETEFDQSAPAIRRDFWTESGVENAFGKPIGPFGSEDYLIARLDFTGTETDPPQSLDDELYQLRGRVEIAENEGAIVVDFNITAVTRYADEPADSDDPRDFFFEVAPIFTRE